jgi:hypothetical protein
VRADTAPNDRLQLLIAQAGISYEALARSVCHIAAENGDNGLRANKSSVAHWIAGTRPQPRTARLPRRGPVTTLGASTHARRSRARLRR